MQETEMSSKDQTSNRIENAQSNVTESNISTVYSYPVNSSPTTSFDLDPITPETPLPSSNEHHEQPIIAQFQSPQMLEPNALSASASTMPTLEVSLGNLPESVATLELSDVEQPPEPTNTLPTSPASSHPRNSSHINREVPLTAALTENLDYEELMRALFAPPHVPDGAIESFHFPLRDASLNAQTTHQPSPDTSPTSNQESSGGGQISFGQTMTGPSESDITLLYNRSVPEVSGQIQTRFNESQISLHRIQAEYASSSTQTVSEPLPVSVSASQTPRVRVDVNTLTNQTSSTALQSYPVDIDRAHVLILSETPEEHSLIVNIRQLFHCRLHYTNIKLYGNLRAEEARMRLCAEVLDASKNWETDLLFVVVVGRVRLPNWDAVYMRDNTRWTVSEMHYDLYVATEDKQRRAALDLLAGKPKVLCVLAWPYRLREAPLYQPRNANYDATASSPEGYNVVKSPRTDTRQPAQLVEAHRVALMTNVPLAQSNGKGGAKGGAAGTSNSLSVSPRHTSFSHPPNQSLGQ